MKAHTTIHATNVNPGEFARLDLAAQVELLIVVWSTGRTEGTAKRIAGLMRRFVGMLTDQDVTSLSEVTSAHCRDFLTSPTRRDKAPAAGEQKMRLVAINDLFSTAQDIDERHHHPAARIKLIRDNTPATRPVTDDELDKIRLAALGTYQGRGDIDRRAALIALCEATSTTGEIPLIRWSDVDLEEGTINLPGVGVITPRTGRLTSWGLERLRAFNHTSNDAHVIVVNSKTHQPNRHSSQATVVNQVGAIMRSAGITGAGVRPDSIRRWGAVKILHAHGIEAAARALGVSSLDAARRQLCRDARTPTR